MVRPVFVTACIVLLGCATALAHADVLTNLIARYSFDQSPVAEKVMNDASKRADGVAKTYPKGTGPTWFVEQGGMMEFSGSDYILIPKTIADRNTFSVAAWFNAAPEGAYEMKIVAAQGGYSLCLSRSGKGPGRKLRWAQVGEEKWAPPVWSDNTVAPDEWHHVVVTSDGDRLAMFVDGVQQKATVSWPSKIRFKLQENIGTWAIGNGDQWEGCLDDIRYYDIALSVAQVQEVFAARSKTGNIRPTTTRPAEPAAPPVPVTWVKPGGIDYLKLVRAYADVMIERGRDVYGREHSPLFAAALNRRTYKVSRFPGVPGLRAGDRILTGANPMLDENLYQVLYALTQITGDPRYAKEADATLKYFFERCQSPATGLMAWGEHIGWDFEDEALAGNGIHEFARPWVLWDQTFKIAPDAVNKFAKGLWDHQIYDDKKTFSRHASWAKHGPQTQHEFPRHGGFYIATWASAYGRSQDPTYITAIAAVLDVFEANKSKVSGAIMAQTAVERDNFKIFWPSSTLSLAIDLGNAIPVLPDPVKSQAVKMADEIDQVYTKLKHDLDTLKGGFVINTDVDTLEPLPAQGGILPYSRTWDTTTYGGMTNAGIANLCYGRYLQLQQGPTRDAYKALILASAERYFASEPDVTRVLFPRFMGSAIWHLLCAYKLSGDERFKQRAFNLADLAVKTFITDGCPLPRASSVNDHYEAITEADTLMMSFLRLSQINDKGTPINLVNTDR